jgi:site-specific DNA-methyltransferase (adenine-specific)
MSNARCETIGRATLYLGDCRDVLSSFGDAVGIFDPPYGIGYKVNSRAPRPATRLKAIKATETLPVAQIIGDGEPFDPVPWLGFKKIAIFGAHHFSNRLPLGRWLVWDKRRESPPDDHSDGDLIWLSGDHRLATRIHRQLWRGLVREGEENPSRQLKQHPNQKPVSLLLRIMEMLSVAPGETVADPYMGSASTGVAALRFGCRFVGAEIDPVHFSTACRRVEREQLQPQLSLHEDRP